MELIGFSLNSGGGGDSSGGIEARIARLEASRDLFAMEPRGPMGGLVTIAIAAMNYLPKLLG